MGLMAPPGQREEQHEHEKRGGFRVEDDAPRDELAEMMEGDSRAAVAMMRSWDSEDSVAVDRFLPGVYEAAPEHQLIF
jgi:hypothetical protein